MSDKPIALYRHFDKDGQLLYIGVSANTMARLSQHQQTAQWLIKAVKMTTEWFSDRQIALEAEKIAIEKEKPIHNIKHNAAVHPPAALKTLKTIRLNDDLIAELELLAEREGRSFSNMVAHLLTKSIQLKEARGVVVGSPPAKRFVKTTIKDQKSVIDYLNVKSGSNYQHVMSNIKLISGRLAEGRTVEEIKQVIDRQCMEWPPGHHMRKYLRPKTLFNAEKFNQYFGQLGQPVIPEQQYGQTQGHKSAYQQRVEAGDAKSFNIDTEF